VQRGDAAVGELGRVAGQVPVYPDGPQAQPCGGQDVVHPAARDVDPVLRRGPGALGEHAEAAEAGLVGAGLLGGDDRVEFHGEGLPGRGEQAVVAVDDGA
jgi:hypothetical protein